MKLRLPFFRLNWGLIAIVALFLVLVWLDLPKTDLKFSVGTWQVDRTMQHPKISFGTNPQTHQPKFFRDLEPRLGLDLEGGVEVTLEADMQNVAKEQRDDALTLSRDVIERRINLFGVAEPVIQTSKSGETYRINVSLAGVKDINQAIELIGQTAKLEFREFTQEAESATSSAIPVMDNTLPAGIDGGDLTSARADFQPQTNEPIVLFQVQPESQEKFFQATQRLQGRRMIIFLDGTAVSAPTVQQAIRDSGSITGQFTVEQAKQLALQLNAGALKAPVHIVSQRNVGATLGESAIRQSIIAGIVGITIVGIFMFANYGVLGLIADIALLIYTLLSLTIFKFIPITLTLAGIAGFILSIGMAVDANILIFERMREEQRWGKDKKTALKLGFDRALTSIKASNFSTLITTLILYMFGTGIVRGFAFTLAIGVIASMFTAITITKTMLKALYRL